MPARDLSRWTQNEDGTWRYNPTTASAPTALSDGTAEADYSEMTLAQLRDELVSRGLPKSGNKNELIERLQENDQLA